MKVGFVFPGQGSQKVGMGRGWAEGQDAARQAFAEADAALGESLSKLCFEGPESELQLTRNTQPTILATSVAALRGLRAAAPGLEPAYLAGHSLGEYSALVTAGVLSLTDAVVAVRRRGQHMQEVASRPFHSGGGREAE